MHEEDNTMFVHLHMKRTYKNMSNTDQVKNEQRCENIELN